MYCIWTKPWEERHWAYRKVVLLSRFVTIWMDSMWMTGSGDIVT